MNNSLAQNRARCPECSSFILTFIRDHPEPCVVVESKCWHCIATFVNTFPTIGLLEFLDASFCISIFLQFQRLFQKESFNIYQKLQIVFDFSESTAPKKVYVSSLWESGRICCEYFFRCSMSYQNLSAFQQHVMYLIMEMLKYNHAMFSEINISWFTYE